VKLSAMSGECAPVRGMPCASIPSGMLTFSVQDVTNMEDIGSDPIPIEPGANVILMLDLNDQTDSPTLIPGKVDTAAICSTIDYADLPDNDVQPPARSLRTEASSAATSAHRAFSRLSAE